MIEIFPLSKDNINYVNTVLQSNQDIFGTYIPVRERKDFVFYQVEMSNKLAGFFGVGEENDKLDIYIAGVYVKKSFRRKGVFNAIINFLREKYKGCNIYFNALDTNQLAISIYSRKFKYMNTDGRIKWFFINNI